MWTDESQARKVSIKAAPSGASGSSPAMGTAFGGSPSAGAEDMTEQQRGDLQRTIEERKKEIAARKELLQRLKNQMTTGVQTAAEPVKNVDDYLKEAMALAEKAKEQVKIRIPELTAPLEEAGRETVAAAAAPVLPARPSIGPAIEVPKIEAQKIVYEKSSQTDFPVVVVPPSPTAALPSVSPTALGAAPSVVSEIEGSAVAQASVTAAAVSELPEVLPEEHGPIATAAEALRAAQILDLTADERNQIMRSEAFRKFMERSTFTIEKALNQDRIVDIFETYSGVGHDIIEERETETLGDIALYEEPRLSTKRPVFCVKPSPKFPSLFLAGYGRPREGGTFDADGACLIWSIESTQRPVHSFISPSPVTAACFNQYNPNLVLGGTSVGSILMWDMRASQRYIQKTRTQKDSHQCQVQHMSLFGSAHNQILLTVDESNRVCLWNVAMSLTLANGIELGTKKAAPEGGWAGASQFLATAADVKNNRLMGGLADGSAYLASISNTETEIVEMFQSPNREQQPTHRWHGGPITGVAIKPTVGDFRLDLNLALTSSMDWTVRLWDLDQVKAPIKTFDVAEDYIFDVKWSPSHPTVFAAADGTGSVSIWNLHRSWHRPALRQEIFPKCAMTKLDFIMEGKALVMASSKGTLATAPISPVFYSLRAGTSPYFDTNVEGARAQQHTEEGAPVSTS